MRATGNGRDAPRIEASDAFTELYLPLCEPVAHGSRILGHLGQSLDGFIATSSGDSTFVNDQENIRHLHRLRALHDAVIVGAGTVANDNPALTTRLVSGDHPVRVVLDPDRRLDPNLRVFTDGLSKTILVVAEPADGSPAHGQADVMAVECSDDGFDLPGLVEALAARGLRRLFVEGGGSTVTRFFDAGLLDRLQIAIAPVLIGAGTPGIRPQPNDRMASCPRPAHRVFAMGQDILFDCVLGERAAAGSEDRTTMADDVPIRRVR